MAKGLPILMDVPHRSAAAHKRDVLDRGRTWSPHAAVQSEVQCSWQNVKSLVLVVSTCRHQMMCQSCYYVKTAE